MEWHFDAQVLDLPCPNANPITAKICRQACDTVLTEHPGKVLKCFDSNVCFAGDLFENLGCGLCPDEGFKAEAGALPPLRQSRLPRTVR